MLESALANCLSSIQASSIYLAYSGGVDSTVLLDLLVTLKQRHPRYQITAVHVHHGLSMHADHWQLHCEKVCQQYSVPLINLSIHSEQTDEASLRIARYQAIADVMPTDAVLLTGHSATDQVETMLLQLLRGAGPKGLAGMRQANDVFGIKIIRPLLAIRREQIIEYAITHKLQWVEDDSNSNQAYARNFLRHDILPRLFTRWPSMEQAILRSSQHCADTQYLLDKLAALQLAVVQQGDQLLIDQLNRLTVQEQQNLIRFWLSQQQLPLPNKEKLAEVLRVMTAKPDRCPLIAWPGAELRVWREKLYAQKPFAPHDPTRQIRWNNAEPLSLPTDLGCLQPIHELSGQELMVKFRCGGEQVLLPGREHHHCLKKLLQQWGVPPWLRDRVPLVFAGEQLVAVAGYYCYGKTGIYRG